MTVRLLSVKININTDDHIPSETECLRTLYNKVSATKTPAVSTRISCVSCTVYCVCHVSCTSCVSRIVYSMCSVGLCFYTSDDGIDGSRRCFLEYEDILQKTHRIILPESGGTEGETDQVGQVQSQLEGNIKLNPV